MIDVLLSQRRDGTAAQAFFAHAISAGRPPVEVTTDRAPVYPRILDEVSPSARHVLEQYARNLIEAKHSLLKATVSSRGVQRWTERSSGAKKN